MSRMSEIQSVSSIEDIQASPLLRDLWQMPELLLMAVQQRDMAIVRKAAKSGSSRRPLLR